MIRSMKPLTPVFAFIILIPIILISYSIPGASGRDLTPGYRVIASYPHDPNTQTEGFEFIDGVIYEGTGPCLNGPSSLRKIKMDSGEVLMSRELPIKGLFGEGITIYNEKIVELTYRSRIGFVYDKKNFELLKKFHYPTEGWGITNDGQDLIMSDGSATLRFLDPDTLKKVREIEVRDDKGPVLKLNELEYINGVIFANVFETSRIVCILPETGQVTGYIDLSILLKDRFPEKDPLALANGIAYDHERNRMFITGKYWSQIYELEINR